VVSRGPSHGDVGIAAFCLRQRDGGDHGSDDEDSRHSVRKHFPHDVFRGLQQLIAPNEDPYLFFQGGMAAQKLHAPRLQDLHARVLIDGIPIVWIFGGRLFLQPTFVIVEEVLPVAGSVTFSHSPIWCLSQT